MAKNITKTDSDYMGNDQFNVFEDDQLVGVIRHIKRENIRTFSRHMTTDRTWVIAGRTGMHYRTRKDAVAAL